MPKPKAVLFDIGGVCVISPMQAIQDYEIKNNIPKDYINFAISQTSPNGAWHKLERGEIKMDDAFFQKFRSDLHQQHTWERYHSHFKNRKQKPSLAESAKANATQLRDPVSLKAETSSRVPTPGEAGAGPSVSLATTARSGGRNSLQESYQKNMLGDPTSLKNEGSASEPVGAADQATGYAKDGQYDGARGVGGSSKPELSSLQESYKRNPLGDPTSLKNEGGSLEPLPDQQDTGDAKDWYSPHSTQHTRSLSSASLSSQLGTGGNSLKQSYKKNMLGDPTSLLNEGSKSDPIPAQQDTGSSKPSSSAIPPMPDIDTTAVFWNMMAVSRHPDPHMLPALKNLRASEQFVVGALSNTVIFPDDHPYSRVDADNPDEIRTHFDVFVSSAHIGLRKPDPAIYRVAIGELDRLSRAKGGSGIAARDVVFLDDIGSNLKAAREVGLRTIRVNLGRVDEAVRELEAVTGLKLAGDRAKL